MIEGTDSTRFDIFASRKPPSNMSYMLTGRWVTATKTDLDFTLIWHHVRGFAKYKRPAYLLTFQLFAIGCGGRI